MQRESSSPPPDQTSSGVQAGGDLDVADTLLRVQDDPGALHILKRQLLRPRGPLKHDTLGVCEFDPVTGRAVCLESTRQLAAWPGDAPGGDAT